MMSSDDDSWPKFSEILTDLQLLRKSNYDKKLIVCGISWHLFSSIHFTNPSLRIDQLSSRPIDKWTGSVCKLCKPGIGP